LSRNNGRLKNVAPSVEQCFVVRDRLPSVKTSSPSRLAAFVALLAGAAFYFSTNALHKHFDYTYRIALAMLHGHVGLSGPPLSWLSELVPVGETRYSVCPLGAVLVNLPPAVLHELGLFREWPARGLAAAIAAGCVYFFYHLSYIAEMSRPRRVVLALFPIFATWAWCNLGFAGAWQLALGFAILGQAGALHYSLIRPRPFLAGFWFAIAFGNRTELAITLPVYFYFWFSRRENAVDSPAGRDSVWRRLLAGHSQGIKLRRLVGSPEGKALAGFLVMPAVLLFCTALYNLARFGSPLDFGYSRIPGVLNEPWYRHGLFSLHAIGWNVHEMLFRGLIEIPNFPYYQPHAFGCSIFFACPFLFLLFREGGPHRIVCWLTIAVLTFILWCHGNAGGWQFSYRYAMILLPWMFLLIAGNGPPKLRTTEGALFLISVFFNGIAVYQFLWTSMIHV